jgi:hypothetical protein
MCRSINLCNMEVGCKSYARNSQFPCLVPSFLTNFKPPSFNMMTKTKTRWKRDVIRTQSFILHPRTALSKCISIVLLLLICSFSVQHLSPLQSTGMTLMLKLSEMSVDNINTAARMKQRQLWQRFFEGDLRQRQPTATSRV